MTRTIGMMIGAVAALGVGGGISAIGTVGKKDKSAYHLEKTTVDRGTIVGKVTATGSLSAMVTVQVGSQVSGRIQELSADFGSKVKQGQVIARLDPRLFAAALEQARANRQAAQANLAQARAKQVHAQKELARASELSGKKLISQAEMDARAAEAAAATAAVAAAVGELAQARAGQNQAEVNLGYTTIVSPINGTVISRNVDVGQTVAASLQAPTLFTIAEDLRKMQVHAAVSEADVGKLAPGMPASFAVDAYPHKRFQGVIRQIRDAPQTLQNVVTYDAVVEVDNDALELKPGMTANVTFVYAERQDVLRVPTAALRFRPPPELLTTAAAPGAAAAGGESAQTHADKKAAKRAAKAAAVTSGGPGAGAPVARSVWVLRDGALVEVPVSVGVVDGSRVEVESAALNAGDVVITDAISRADRAESRKGRAQAQAQASSKPLF
ncbi:MAG TPA: efflux RND transporter periplasmic adaptor subunit [Polyangia bacterium]|jgi:HlyD family secretion protein|nr:efflux RND transporter periplasmic adaptor subunit [Polyangia bacterium]